MCLLSWPHVLVPFRIAELVAEVLVHAVADGGVGGHRHDDEELHPVIGVAVRDDRDLDHDPGLLVDDIVPVLDPPANLSLTTHYSLHPIYLTSKLASRVTFHSLDSREAEVASFL